MTRLWVWLADSPLGGAAKAASGAALVWILDNVHSLNLAPIVEVAIIAALPVIINAVNPEDFRYGKGMTVEAGE